MKNRILTTMMLAIIIIFSIQLSVKAVIISTDKTVESGSGTVTISVTANQALGAYTLKLTDTAGLTLVSASGGEVSADKKTITGSSAEGTKNLGTFTFNVPTVDKDSTYNIKFLVTGMETPSLDPIANENNTAVLVVKAPVKVEPEPEPPKQDPKPETPVVEEKPEFKDANKTMYASKDINLRSSWSTNSKATSIDKGTELKVTATSSNKVNDYIWYRVSYNGATLYVASNLLTDTKPETEKTAEQPAEQPKDETPTEEPTTVDEKDNEDENTEIKDGLKSLEIAGITLSPTFRPDVYEYRVIVRKDIRELTINAVPALEGATITIAGHEDLQEGENLIAIMVYNAKNEAQATYQITVNKNTLDLTDTDKMLKMGNKEAKRNATIFLVLITVEVIVLIIILILKKKHQNEENVNNEKFIDVPDFESDVENTQIETNTEDVEKIESDTLEETYKPKKEKRKGKHF